MVKAKIKRLTNTAIIPTKGSEKSAGYDLYADEEVGIEPGTCVKIHTGIAITPPEGYFGAGFVRSSLATKFGLRPANATMIMDQDYTGEYIVPLYNDGTKTYIIKRGDRIAQIVFLPYLNIEFEEVEELDQTERGFGGFGSTGK